VNRADLLDTAGAILQMLDVPVPIDVDAKVLSDYFRCGSNLKRSTYDPVSPRIKSLIEAISSHPVKTRWK